MSLDWPGFVSKSHTGFQQTNAETGINAYIGTLYSKKKVYAYIKKMLIILRAKEFYTDAQSHTKLDLRTYTHTRHT